ncbi:MAG: hypothetical protein U1B80_04790 [Anaerolineaceae bacterium]|nr:hypothetical protein [Anaerolineaceae bacterium]
MRREVLTWEDVDRIIDHLVPQFEVGFDAMLMITRGGIVPGGMLAEALNLTTLLTAAVDFPVEMEVGKEKDKLRAWPQFIQFPENVLLRHQKVIVIDDVWGSGRTITAVKNRVSGAGGIPFTCVLHFNPYRSLFGSARPDYFAATTDAHIVYPWEIDRGPDRALLRGLSL